jgi:hypothetical protein
LIFILVCFIGVNANVVPKTYKQKKTPVTAPKADGEDDKAAAAGEAPTAEGETPAPMGRGAR